MNKLDQTVTVKITYKEDPIAKDQFINFIVNYLLDHNIKEREGEMN